ncbi:flagellar hook-length control protein FliK [Chromohalobacter sp. 296-RDG]|uniref:flagellar hook-length control protein FliK n=1 Tax=Chromohalobacter sp. 296-RDG TaxID=2994062 RepID=UPI002468D180|nr:flagellar hook-length control protein FliK [Chromohalobacter sp. 296-RDG]
MSGITPIIDTLLHQVLGQRIDAPRTTDLPAPVKPVLSGNAIESLTREGGGLQQRGSSQAEFTPARASALLEAGVPSGKSEEHSAATPSSSTTHFSTAARTIADVLARFPAPPSSITSPQPLLQEGEASPRLLASQLQQNIQHSGVFYESHLARWLKGEWSTAALAREPQMALAPRMPVATGLATTETPHAARMTDTGPPTSRATMAEMASPATLTSLRPATTANHFAEAPLLAQQGDSPELLAVRGDMSTSGQHHTLASSALQQIGTDQNDTLQSVVRHQLEMLVTPSLRWEGMLWPGVMLAMTLQQWSEGDGQDADGQAQSQGHDKSPWHSEMNISLPNLGDVHIAMTLRAERASLSISAPEGEGLERLSEQVSALHERLDALGVQAVIDVHRMPDNDASEERHE